MSQAPQFVKPGPADPSAGEPQHWVTASFRARLGAAIFDTVVVVGLGFVATIPVWQLSDRAGAFSDTAGWFATTTAGSTTSDLLISALEYAIITAVWLFYLALLPLREGREHGQTLGMRAFDIRFVMADGAPLEKDASWRRALAFSVISAFGILAPIADALFGTPPTMSDGADALSFVAFGILLVLGLSTDGRRLLYDHVARTTVVGAVPHGRPRDHDPDVHGAAAFTPGGFAYGTTSLPLPVRGRPRTAVTWLLAAITLLAIAGTIVGTLYPSL